MIRPTTYLAVTWLVMCDCDIYDDEVCILMIYPSALLNYPLSLSLSDISREKTLSCKVIVFYSSALKFFSIHLGNSYGSLKCLDP